MKESYSLLEQALVEPGTYTVSIASYKEFPALKNLTDPDPKSDKNTSHLIDPSRPADAIIRNPFILIETTASAETEPFRIKLYSARIPYFMKAINRQFDYTLTGIKLSEMLEFLRTHEFDIQLSYDPKYGAQYDFRAAE